MKNLIPVLLFQLIFLQFGWSQTEVSGGIFEPTTWTEAESPYVVTDDVVVFPDASLTIEPGVTIRFYADTRLELRAGDLHAIGTENAPIVFTTDETNPTNLNKWNGIENTTTTSDSVSVNLDYVTIEHAKIGMHYGAGVAYRYISNAIFRHNNTGVFDGALGYNWVTISNTEFTDNIVGMQGRMSAINCNFENNGTGFANPMTFGDINEGARVTNCTFTNNGTAVGTIGQIITIAIIDDSDFTDNERGFDGYWAIIDKSYFTNSSEFGVKLIKGEVQNSLFSDNQAGLVIGTFPGELSIYDNLFTTDTVALEIGGQGATIFNNTICNSIEYGAVLTTNLPIDLNENCWCTTDLDEIAMMVFDAYDDVSLGIATYNDLNPDCIQGLVFPGDGNNNGVANAWDILSIGLSYGMEGAVRVDAQTNWIGQEADDWTNTMANSVNSKHADCNGDGTVNFQDVEVIGLNYGAIHLNPTEYQPIMTGVDVFKLSFEMLDTFVLGETIQVDIVLADAANPVNDLYGIAFAIESDVTFFESNSFQLNTDNSWLGDEANMLAITQEFQADGRVEVGLVKNDLQPSNGYGVLASFEFVMSEEIIAALVANENPSGNLTPESLFLRIVDIEAITSEGLNLLVENEETEVFLSDTNDVSNEVTQVIHIFPNPADNYISLDYQDLNIEKVTLFNAAGQVLQVFENAVTNISLEGLHNGLYILQIQTSGGTGIKKFMLQK